MVRVAAILVLFLVASCAAPPVPPSAPRAPSAPIQGVLLTDVTWLEAEKLLGPETIVVIPIGAASKEHGPHLLLSNDWRMAEYLKGRVVAAAAVVVAPTLGYHFYPAFLEYPGSTSLRLETARDMTVDIVKSLARHGPRRFYALNTGVSTLRALRPAAEALAAEGILLHYTNLLDALGPIERAVGKQEGGTHADEIETSMMLYIDPRVRRHAEGGEGFSRQPSRGAHPQAGGRGDLLSHGHLGRSDPRNAREGAEGRRGPRSGDPRRHRGAPARPAADAHALSSDRRYASSTRTPSASASRTTVESPSEREA